MLVLVTRLCCRINKSRNKIENQTFSPPICFSGFTLTVFLSLVFNSQDIATDEPRAGTLLSFFQQGWACSAHTSSASQTLASADQELWTATMLALIGPAEVPKSSGLAGARAHWCRLVQWDSEQAYRFTPTVPIVGQGLGEWNFRFEEWSKREIFASGEGSQRLRFKKLMVNDFSTVHYFKLKIEMDVSTASRIHMLLLTSACSSCLRRLIPWLITVSFQSKSLKSILLFIWPFCL